jgi:hypothetical protein
MGAMTTTWPAIFNPTPTRPTPSDVGSNPWLLWRVESPSERTVLSVAELAECMCPDLCDRDHVNE